MMKHIKSIVTLTLIAAVVAVLMAATNSITAPIIEAQEAAAVQEAMAEVLPGGEGFALLDTAGMELPETITEVYSENNGGYVFKMTTAGYGSGLVVMCGINAEGIVTGATCIASNETLSAEKTYGENLVGADASSIDSVEVIAGITRTTAAYKNAVKDAITTFEMLKGGA